MVIPDNDEFKKRAKARSLVALVHTILLLVIAASTSMIAISLVLLISRNGATVEVILTNVESTTKVLAKHSDRLDATIANALNLVDSVVNLNTTAIVMARESVEYAASVLGEPATQHAIDGVISFFDTGASQLTEAARRIAGGVENVGRIFNSVGDAVRNPT